MTRDIVIFGAGGLARELCEWMRRDGRVRIRAFVSDRDSDLRAQHLYPVVDRLGAEALVGHPSYVLGISDPASKRRVAAELDARGWTPVTWIDPSAIVATSSIIGNGVVICPFCTISPQARVDDFAFLNVGCGVGHDAHIGAHASLLGRASVNGHVVVGEEALIGSGALIVPGRRIGARAVVGIGSVVIANVPEGVSVFGNPARRIQS